MDKIKLEMWPGFGVAMTAEGWKKHIKMCKRHRSEASRLKGIVIERELKTILENQKKEQ